MVTLHGQPVSPIAWMPFVALLVALANSTVFTCMCNHVAPAALPVNAAAAALAWWCFARGRHTPRLVRNLLVAGTALNSVVFARNAMDVLWFGHGALMRFPRAHAEAIGLAVVALAGAALLLAGVLLVRKRRRPPPASSLSS